MQEVALFNLGPIFKLLLLAAVVAMGPLAWVWLRHRHHDVPQRVHQLTALSLFLCFDLVLFGSFTRLSDSGLGCPDWPGCYGHASPLGASEAIEAAQTALPTGPVTLSKAWIEMIHRYLAMTVGVLILTLAAFSWKRDRSVWAWSTLSLVWVCVQGAFGALTVTMKLFPAIVSLHLMGGMLLLVILLMQLLRQRHAHWAESRISLPKSVRGWLMASWALLLLQIVLGAWVSSNYAVMACNTYPLCQGAWWPEMNFDKGFDLWRSLGLDGDGQALPFQALTAIHFTHRWHAMPVAALLLWSSFLLYRHGLSTQARGLWLLVLLQFITGISNAVLGWPLLAALLHTASAAGLLLLLSWALGISESRPSGHIATTFSRPDL
jgi:cytochrome c oxidase assembly protein subunit 15